ncbi:MAG: LCP family protein [Propionibacteriaceae bacterium]|jgi:LCP family protein required for cell wall assembly|nr:LCP family protein [Propionibacteriaceae bacterium]
MTPPTGPAGSATTQARHSAAPSAGPVAKLFMVVGKLLAAVSGLAFVGVVAYIAWLNVIPYWWLAGATVLGAAVGLAVIIPLWRTRLPGHGLRYTVLALLALIGLCGSTLAYLAASQVRDTLFVEVQRPTEQMVTYDVLALLDHADGLDSLAGQLVGQVTTDPNLPLAQAKLAETVAVTYQSFDSLSEVADGLLARQTDAVLIDDAYLAVYDEARPEFASQYKILGSFQVASTASSVPVVTPTPAKSTDTFLAYISGIDQYGSINTSGRSDVNILVAVNPATGHILLVHVPRDYYVQLHGTTGLKDKLTHAGVYGIDMSINTMSDLVDEPIDYYLRVNFNTVITLVDLIGGIDVYSDYDFTSRGVHFTVGYNHLNGEQALVFSRERYSFAGGDRVRGQNQERVIEALIAKLTQPAQLTHAGSILSTLSGGMETNMPGDRMMQLVQAQLTSGQTWTVERMSVDGVGAMLPTYTYGSQNLSVLIPDEATVTAAKARLDAVLNR